MANLWFRNVGANWLTAGNWSTTADLATPSASAPTSADACFLVAGSGTCNINGVSVCASLDCTGYTNTFSGTSTLTISGNITLSSTMTITATTTLVTNTASTLRSNGKTWNGNMTFNGAVIYTFFDNWTVNGNFTSAGGGTKTLNGNNLNINGNFVLSATLNGTTTIVMNGTGTVSGTGQLANNLTINGATTFTGTVNYNTGIFKYQSGSLNMAGATMSINAAASFDTNTLELNGSILFPASGTYTFISPLRIGAAGAITVTSQSKVFNGSTIYVKGTLGGSNSITLSGTTNFVLNDNVTWNMFITSALNSLTIDSTGTITLGTNVTGFASMTFVKGTVVTTGSTLVLNQSTTFNTTVSGSNKILWNNIQFSAASGNHILSSDLWVAGNANFSTNGTKTFTGSNFYIGGNMSVSTGVTMTGTTKFVLNGTGTWSSAGILGLNLDVDTNGTTTVTGSVAYGHFSNPGVTLKYKKGTVNTSGSTVYLNGSCIFDTAGISWNNITCNVGDQTFTINSPLIATGALSLPDNSISFIGTSGFTVGTLKLQGIFNNAGIYTFIPGVDYRVTAFIDGSSTAPNIRTVKSTVNGTKAKFILNVGATCSIANINFTDIDASGGRVINTFMGAVANCINVNTFADPIRTMSKAFIS